MLSELQGYDCPPLMPKRGGGKGKRLAVQQANETRARLLCRVDPTGNPLPFALTPGAGLGSSHVQGGSSTPSLHRSMSLANFRELGCRAWR
jgi:hypothetical protein